MTIEAILLAAGAGDAEHVDRLAEETVSVTGSTGVTVVIGYVFTKDEYDDALDNLGFNITVEEVSADDVVRRRAIVRGLTRRFDDADIGYVTHGRVGHHGEKLVELAGEVDADRLIVGGRKCSLTDKAVFGSIAQEAMLEASCPVTFARADIK